MKLPGPSILVHTIVTPTGGRFNISLDGYPTASFINTQSTNDTGSLPTCYPNQYPPVRLPPADYETRDVHTVTLIYAGSVKGGVNATGGIFDAFAIPFFDEKEFEVTGGVRSGRINTSTLLFAAAIFAANFILFF